MSISRCIFSSSRNVRGRAIAPNATKGLDSREIAKAARNLLLHFDHAHISLGQIIVKGDRQVVQEGQQVTCSGDLWRGLARLLLSSAAGGLSFAQPSFAAVLPRGGSSPAPDGRCRSHAGSHSPKQNHRTARDSEPEWLYVPIICFDKKARSMKRNTPNSANGCLK